jgi:hypothetical protein
MKNEKNKKMKEKESTTEREKCKMRSALDDFIFSPQKRERGRRDFHNAPFLTNKQN